MCVCVHACSLMVEGTYATYGGTYGGLLVDGGRGLEEGLALCFGERASGLCL